MLKAKSFIVVGNTVTKNGVRVRDLAEQVDVKINEFLGTVAEDALVDVKINTQIVGASGDYAFVTLLYKGAAEEEEGDEEGEGKKKKKK